MRGEAAEPRRCCRPQSFMPMCKTGDKGSSITQCFVFGSRNCAGAILTQNKWPWNIKYITDCLQLCYYRMRAVCLRLWAGNSCQGLLCILHEIKSHDLSQDLYLSPPLPTTYAWNLVMSFLPIQVFRQTAIWGFLMMHIKSLNIDPLPKQYLNACQHFLTCREIKQGDSLSQNFLMWHNYRNWRNSSHVLHISKQQKWVEKTNF